uniref:CCHC-type domain-containing protein n=1 Tax=Nicotiana tabacum TaxID=4097 RepID=A0A1S4BZX5_TOBAC|nr:PREDICTED: uncharacterized protein LOC107813678 [Nicotiana tabacum]
MNAISEPTVTVPKTRKEYNDTDRKARKTSEQKRYSSVEIWEALQIAHEGTTQVKQSNIDTLTTEYELFRMKDDESIQDMHTRFTSIINELHSLGEIIPRNKLVRKILSVLPGSWESKLNAITEAKDLQKLTIDELIGNLKIYEMKKKNDHERRKPKKKKNLVLKIDNNDSSGEYADMANLTKRFQKMQDQYKNNTDKTAKRNPVLDKRFKRKDAADNVVKQALVAWGDSSSESAGDDEQGDTFMMAVESEAAEYDSIFALMKKSDEDEDGEDDKNMLTMELGEVEHEREYLVVVVVDLKETIKDLKKEKDALTEKIENVKHERDDLLVVIVDLKETIEELKRENSSGNTQKGKEVASEAHLRLENELKGIGFQKEKTPYNPHSKYITVPDNWLCTHCGNTGHFKESCKARFQSQQKNNIFAEKVPTAKEHGPSNKKCMMPAITRRSLIRPFPHYKGEVKGRSQRWYMDSGCSKHMTGSTDDFLSLKVLQGGSVSFGNDKKVYILGVRRVGKTLTHSIENVYYVNGLKYSLLSASQICDKGNKVEFLSKICTVTNLVTGEVKIGTCKLFIAEQVGQEGPGPWASQVKVQGSQDLSEDEP